MNPFFHGFFTAGKLCFYISKPPRMQCAVTRHSLCDLHSPFRRQDKIDSNMFLSAYFAALIQSRDIIGHGFDQSDSFLCKQWIDRLLIINDYILSRTIAHHCKCNFHRTLRTFFDGFLRIMPVSRDPFFYAMAREYGRTLKCNIRINLISLRNIGIFNRI